METSSVRASLGFSPGGHGVISEVGPGDVLRDVRATQTSVAAPRQSRNISCYTFHVNADCFFPGTEKSARPALRAAVPRRLCSPAPAEDLAGGRLGQAASRLVCWSPWSLFRVLLLSAGKLLN